MKLAPQSRDILRQYKALINARRRDAGQGEPLPLPAARENPGRLRLPEKTSPRLRRRALSSPLSVAVARNSRIIRDIFL
jgi:hypothetical protein